MLSAPAMRVECAVARGHKAGVPTMACAGLLRTMVDLSKLGCGILLLVCGAVELVLQRQQQGCKHITAAHEMQARCHEMIEERMCKHQQPACACAAMLRQTCAFSVSKSLWEIDKFEKLYGMRACSAASDRHLEGLQCA